MRDARLRAFSLKWLEPRFVPLRVYDGSSRNGEKAREPA
jgi:hypothetical protein